MKLHGCNATPAPSESNDQHTIGEQIESSPLLLLIFAVILIPALVVAFVVPIAITNHYKSEIRDRVGALAEQIKSEIKNNEEKAKKLSGKQELSQAEKG